MGLMGQAQCFHAPTPAGEEEAEERAEGEAVVRGR